MNMNTLPIKALNWKPSHHYNSARKLLEDSGKRAKSSLEMIAKETGDIGEKFAASKRICKKWSPQSTMLMSENGETGRNGRRQRRFRDCYKPDET